MGKKFPFHKQMQKIIYSLRIVTALAVKGFQPQAMMQNPKKPQFNCWIYLLTPELEKALDEVFSNG